MNIDVVLLISLVVSIFSPSCGAFIPAQSRHDQKTLLKPLQQPFYNPHYLPPITTTTTSLSMATTQETNKSTLTKDTTWKLRIVLTDLTTTTGKKIPDEMLFSTTIKFLEDEGYEPPQGTIEQVFNDDDDEEKTTTTTRLRFANGVTSSRWQLSEDPNDRKDGLWVWGLFKEPLYPFLLLQLETKEMVLSSPAVPRGDDDDDADAAAPAPTTTIRPLKLYAKVPHKREDDKGAVLSSTELVVREVETVKADLFGAATADLYEEVGIGRISFQPEA